MTNATRRLRMIVRLAGTKFGRVRSPLMTAPCLFTRLATEQWHARSKTVRAHLRLCGSSPKLFTTSQGSISLEASVPISRSTSPYIRGIQMLSIYVRFATSSAEIMLQVDAGIYFRAWGRSQNSSPSQPENLQAVKDKALNCQVWSLFPFSSAFWSRMLMCFVTFRGLNLHWEDRQDAITASGSSMSTSRDKCLIHRMFPGTFPSLCPFLSHWWEEQPDVSGRKPCSSLPCCSLCLCTQYSSGWNRYRPTSENFGQCVLFSSRGHGSDHKSKTAASKVAPFPVSFVLVGDLLLLPTLLVFPSLTFLQPSKNRIRCNSHLMLNADKNIYETSSMSTGSPTIHWPLRAILLLIHKGLSESPLTYSLACQVPWCVQTPLLHRSTHKERPSELAGL